MNIYDLSRNFFNFSFENPEKIKPNHIAIYFFAVEHCNRLGWKEKFGLPTTMVMEAIGIKSYTTYINSLNDLVSYGFIKMIEKSKNQYSSNIVALSNFDKAHDKALDKALIKHTSKHMVKQCESTVSIDRQIYNNTNTQINKSTDAENSIEFLHPQDLEFNNQSLKVKKENTVLPGGRQLHKLNDYIKQNYPTVFRLGQLTDEQCEFIIKTYPKDLIIDKLDAMENKKDLVKRYKSSFLTLKSWLKSGMENYKAKDQSRLSKNLSVLQSALETVKQREQDELQ